VVVLGLVVAGVVVATAAGSASTTQSNRRAARMDAPRLLATLQLPAGSQAASADPSRSSLLGHAPTRPGTRNLVDVHGFWRVPGQPRTVLDWVESHPPAGSTRNMSGASGTSKGISTVWDGYALAPIARVESYRELVVEVAQASGSGTALRADGQVVWLIAKPSSERIPAGVTSIAITARRAGKPPVSPAPVTGSGKVRRIVAYVNSLPPAQPGAVACPNDRGPLVELDFRAPEHRTPVAIAVADGSGCGLVTVRMHGHAQPSLSGGPRLISWLHSALGIKLG
jgi:hypothetical protein